MRGTDTRERLVDAALVLFAERGYARTSVGEIEASAGLVPRSGGMYRHFRSKEDLLRAAVEREMASTEGLATELGLTRGPTDGAPVVSREPRAALTDALQVAFSMMGSRLRLRRIFASDDPHLAEPSQRFREIVERTHGSAAAAFARIAAETGRTIDAQALAVLIAAALTQYSADQSTPLKLLLGVDEDRFRAAVIEMLLSTLGVPE